MLLQGANYTPSMAKFLNQFSLKCKTHTQEQNEYLENLLSSFLKACGELPDSIFISSRTKRFNIALYEAVFTGACEKYFAQRQTVSHNLSAVQINALDQDPEFIEASQKATTQKTNVQKRLQRARAIIV